MQLATFRHEATTFANGSLALNAAEQWLTAHGDDDCEFEVRRYKTGYQVEVHGASPREFRGFIRDNGIA